MLRASWGARGGEGAVPRLLPSRREGVSLTSGTKWLCHLRARAGMFPQVLAAPCAAGIGRDVCRVLCATGSARAGGAEQGHGPTQVRDVLLGWGGLSQGVLPRALMSSC